jgi:hypothetical protein
MKVSSRVVRGPIEELVDRSSGIYLPSYDETRTVIADYQQMAVRRATHRWAFSDLQLHLLMSMQTEQIHIRNLHESIPVGEQRDLYETYVEFAKLPLLAMRRIADGMAFRFLNYDMALVQALNSNAVGVDDFSSAGMLHEVHFAAALTDYHHAGSQVLLCALSDLMNIGDVIIKTAESFEVVEVKKGKSTRGARVSRQKERLEALAEFFGNQGGDIDGNPVQILRLPARRHRLADLEGALRKCKGASPVLLEISSFQTVWCCDLYSSPEVEWKVLREAAERDATARFGKNWVAIASYKQRNHVGITVPVTAFPFPADMIADLILGGLVYVSFVSPEALAAHIEKRGWHVLDVAEVSAQREVLGFPVFHVFKADDPSKNYSFPVDFIIDCGVSLIDIDSVLVGLERSTEGDGRNWTFLYEDENSLWL